ncbi:MAG: hypothetical protein ACK559_37340, partial [bacterium]
PGPIWPALCPGGNPGPHRPGLLRAAGPGQAKAAVDGKSGWFADAAGRGDRSAGRPTQSPASATSTGDSNGSRPFDPAW